jgi:hypothetical protein
MDIITSMYKYIDYYTIKKLSVCIYVRYLTIFLYDVSKKLVFLRSEYYEIDLYGRSDGYSQAQ